MPSGERGRQLIDNDAAIPACLTVIVLAGRPARATILYIPPCVSAGLFGGNGAGNIAGVRVQAKMNRIKQLGRRLVAKAFDGRVAEAHIGAGILNRLTGHATPTIVPAAKAASGSRELRSSVELCNSAMHRPIYTGQYSLQTAVNRAMIYKEG